MMYIKQLEKVSSSEKEANTEEEEEEEEEGPRASSLHAGSGIKIHRGTTNNKKTSFHHCMVRKTRSTHSCMHVCLSLLRGEEEERPASQPASQQQQPAVLPAISAAQPPASS
jgi:hypothetical protein